MSMLFLCFVSAFESKTHCLKIGNSECLTIYLGDPKSVLQEHSNQILTVSNLTKSIYTSSSILDTVPKCLFVVTQDFLSESLSSGKNITYIAKVHYNKLIFPKSCEHSESQGKSSGFNSKPSVE